MSRVLCGAIAILSTAAVASVINVTRANSLPGVTVWDHLGFFFSVSIALGIGALAFEVGKLMGPERRS